MNEEILKLADLSNVKEGDTIWTIQEGNVVVIVRNLKEGVTYPIKTKDHSYTLDGKHQFGNKHPSAFTKNPFENVGFQERWMMVKNDGSTWFKRKAFMQKNGKFITWFSAETDEEVLNTECTSRWVYAKEIEEPKELELTLEEIAEKFGVSVESIKIKK
jgi:hypothetical protein